MNQLILKIKQEKFLKILFDATVFENFFTGIAKSTIFLYEACLKMDRNIEFIGLHRKKLTSNLNKLIKTVQFGEDLSEKEWRILLAGKINAVSPDFVHFPNNGKVPAGIKKNIKVAATIHDVLPLEIPNYFGSGFREKIWKIFYRYNTWKDLNKCDIIFTDSVYSKKQILNNISGKYDITVNQFGPTLNRKILSADKKNPDEQYFIYLGGYDPRKNIHKLVKLFLNLHKTGKITSRLKIVGQKLFISEEFEANLEEGKKTGIISESGYIDDEDLIRYIKEATALIYPSKYEGFGLPPLEAMSLGCPVITARYTSIPEICGDAVVYIEPDDVENFSSAIIELEKNKNLRLSLSKSGLKQSSLLTWEKSAERFISILKGKD